MTRCLHAYAAQFNYCWIGGHSNINTIQKLASLAFRAVQQYGFGKRGCPRFTGHNQMDTVEGKSNTSGIRWREKRVAWLKLDLEGEIDPQERVIAHQLSRRVKYVRLLTLVYHVGWEALQGAGEGLWGIHAGSPDGQTTCLKTGRLSRALRRMALSTVSFPVQRSIMSHLHLGFNWVSWSRWDSRLRSMRT